MNSGATQIQIQKGSGNEIKNNLFIDFTSSINGSITTENNTQNASTSVVSNASTGDFTLTQATGSGTTLTSPYDVDVLGVTFGSDGFWDTGAYEFEGGPDVTAPAAPTGLSVQ